MIVNSSMDSTRLEDLAKDALWLSLRQGLEALGEQFSDEKKSKSSNSDGDGTQKVIMPLMLIVLFAIFVLCFGAAIVGFIAVCPAMRQTMLP